MNKNKILWGSDKNAVIALIAINFVVFVFFRMLYIIFQNNPAMHLKDYNSVLNNFGLYSNFSVFVTKLWTLFTYFITNTTLVGLFVNMLWLFTLSYLLQTIVDNKYIIPSYIYGGIVGGIVFVISAQFVTTHTMLLGSTNAILAIAGTLLAFAPKHKLLPNIGSWGMPVWFLIVVFLLIDVFSALKTSPISIPAHIAGFAAGYVYGYYATKGIDLGKWMHNVYDTLLGKNLIITNYNDQQYKDQKSVNNKTNSN